MHRQRRSSRAAPKAVNYNDDDGWEDPEARCSHLSPVDSSLCALQKHGPRGPIAQEKAKKAEKAAKKKAREDAKKPPAPARVGGRRGRSETAAALAQVQALREEQADAGAEMDAATAALIGEALATVA